MSKEKKKAVEQVQDLEVEIKQDVDITIDENIEVVSQDDDKEVDTSKEKDLKENQVVRATVKKVVKVKKRSKRYHALKEKIDSNAKYSPQEALELLKKINPFKFDPTVELNFNLGIDVRQADQVVRGNLSLPKALSKKIVIAIFDDSQNEKQHITDGADYANPEEIISQISSKKILFDVLITNPKKMAELSKYAKILGPKGLMPTPKNNTVSADIASAIKEIRDGRIEFKADSYGIVHLSVGKLSFDTSDLISNIEVAHKAILKAKPSGAKGTYIKNISLSATMLPGLSLSL